MLAFLDSPIQLIVLMIVVLVIFGPDKMKDIGKQIGRAIREIRRTGADFTNAINLDDNQYHSDYEPPRYDSYGNSYDAANSLSTVPEEDVYHPPSLEAGPSSASEPPRGDFAASAMADTTEDYGVGIAPPAPASAEPAAPVYGVLAPPEQSVPRAGAASTD